jgi:chromosome segregation ATPase
MSDSPPNHTPPANQASDDPPAAQSSALGKVLCADLEALKNDLDQAKVLAAEFQSELAGKTKELAAMKQLFEKTRAHLVQLQLSVTKLRDERHRLANESMRADALQRELDAVMAERDQIQADRRRPVNEALEVVILHRKLDEVTEERNRLRVELNRHAVWYENSRS